MGGKEVKSYSEMLADNELERTKIKKENNELRELLMEVYLLSRFSIKGHALECWYKRAEKVGAAMDTQP